MGDGERDSDGDVDGARVTDTDGVRDSDGDVDGAGVTDTDGVRLALDDIAGSHLDVSTISIGHCDDNSASPE